jgi:uncharacterized protein (TIGR01777 family)
VNCRYSSKNRREILHSRTESTRIVGEAIRKATHPPRIWMNASTATIYRHTFGEPMDEFTGELGGNEHDTPKSWRFSIDVAKRWEEVFFSVETLGTRKIALRSAMTMSPDSGGILDMLLRLVRFRLGGNVGSGNQFVSWIHYADFVSIIDFLIAHNEINGVVNVAAPHPLPYKEFIRALRQAWGTRVGLPSAEWMLEIGSFFLRTETELILKSRRVIPGRLGAAGFNFEFPYWPEAAKNLVRLWRDEKCGALN